jgi:tetrahydromethanopterin S-methyltransferase subunit H
MNGYVNKSLGHQMDDYELEKDPKHLDKLFALASQHVEIDADETLKGILPVIDQIVQGLQKYKPQPQMDADTKVLLDTSMAETKRRADRDQAELGLKDKELQAKIEMDMKKLQQQQQMEMEDLQLRLAIAKGDQDTKERIETARLTRDAAKLNFEQHQAVTTQGVPYGNE